MPRSKKQTKKIVKSTPKTKSKKIVKKTLAKKVVKPIKKAVKKAVAKAPKKVSKKSKVKSVAAKGPSLKIRNVKMDKGKVVNIFILLMAALSVYSFVFILASSLAWML